MSVSGGATVPGPGILVVDVGSSSARCWLFDSAARGMNPGIGSRALYAWNEADGAMERDVEDLFQRVVTTIDAAVAVARAEGLEIAAVAIATFWHSLVGIAADGEAVTALTGWGDARALGAVERLQRRVDPVALHRRTGCFLHPSYPLVRLAWMREEARSRFAEASAWVSFGEYMELRLFGERRCSFSIASASGLLDVHRLQWDAEALEIAGLDSRALSPLADFDEPLSGLVEPYASRWPELASVPWFPALGDGACANLGSGAIGPEKLGITIGTSAAVRVLVEELGSSGVPQDLWAYRLDRSRWVVGRALSNGGNSLRFLRANLHLPPEEEWDAILAATPPGEHGLAVLPFLAAERGPGLAREIGAAVVGLRLDTRPEEVARAWLEAIGYRIAGVCGLVERHFGARGVPRGSGGALNGSHAWAQLLSDILDRPLVLPAEREETSRGAALMALDALGVIPADEAPEPAMAAQFNPDPGRRAAHAEAMLRHQALERILDGLAPRAGDRMRLTEPSSTNPILE